MGLLFFSSVTSLWVFHFLLSYPIHVLIYTYKYPTLHVSLKKIIHRGFPGGSVAGNLPVNAGDTGSIPGPGRFHMQWNNLAHEPQLLSPCSRAHGPQLLRPIVPRASDPQQEKSLQ